MVNRAAHGGVGSASSTAQLLRRALYPASSLPLVYFGFAHVCLGLAFAALVVRPDLAPGSVSGPRPYLQQ
jgi:hypothetical protein